MYTINTGWKCVIRKYNMCKYYKCFLTPMMLRYLPRTSGVDGKGFYFVMKMGSFIMNEYTILHIISLKFIDTQHKDKYVNTFITY